MNNIEGILTSGVEEEVIDKAHLEAALKGKKKLRVKLGIDPTSRTFTLAGQWFYGNFVPSRNLGTRWFLLWAISQG